MWPLATIQVFGTINRNVRNMKMAHILIALIPLRPIILHRNTFMIAVGTAFFVILSFCERARAHNIYIGEFVSSIRYNFQTSF